MKNCPKCNKEHSKSGTYCSYSCANSRTIFSNDDILVENSSYPRHRLKERLINQNLLEYKCQQCGNIGSHNDKPLVLQLDHINGVNNDNRLKNLRFLCPNCHTQQDTYAAKNIKKVGVV